MQINGVSALSITWGYPHQKRGRGSATARCSGCTPAIVIVKASEFSGTALSRAHSCTLFSRSFPMLLLKVDDLERASTGYNILLGPYEPIPGFRVAVVEDGGQPIELVQTTLTDAQLWERALSESIL